MTDESGALWLPNSNFFAGRQGYQARYIILHGTAGGSSAQNTAAFFKSTEGGSNPVSAHYVIGQDGTIVQCNNESDGAWANGYLSAGHDSWWAADVNPNNITVSIEHVKPSLDNSDQLTSAQQQASFRLIRDICNRHGIPQRKADASGGITGHYSIDPVNRSECPGAYPWQELWNYLAGEEESIMINLSTPGVSSYFEQSGQMWRCKSNGIILGNAMLTFYQSFGNSGLCGLTYAGLPLSNEVALPGVAGGTYQSCERVVLVYDPEHKFDLPPGSGPVYTMHINQFEKLFIAQTGTSAPAVDAQQLADYKSKLEQINTLSKV